MSITSTLLKAIELDEYLKEYIASKSSYYNNNSEKLCLDIGKIELDVDIQYHNTWVGITITYLSRTKKSFQSYKVTYYKNNNKHCDITEILLKIVGDGIPS